MGRTDRQILSETLAEVLCHACRLSEERNVLYGRQPADGLRTRSFQGKCFLFRTWDWELEFVNTPHKVRMPVTEGDEVEIVKALYFKYLKLAEVYYQNSGEVDYIDRKNTFENLGE